MRRLTESEFATGELDAFRRNDEYGCFSSRSVAVVKSGGANLLPGIAASSHLPAGMPDLDAGCAFMTGTPTRQTKRPTSSRGGS